MNRIEASQLLRLQGPGGTQDRLVQGHRRDPLQDLFGMAQRALLGAVRASQRAHDFDANKCARDTFATDGQVPA